jgi:hypothetical protein
MFSVLAYFPTLIWFRQFVFVALALFPNAYLHFLLSRMQTLDIYVFGYLATWVLGCLAAWVLAGWLVLYD